MWLHKKKTHVDKPDASSFQRLCVGNLWYFSNSDLCLTMWLCQQKSKQGKQSLCVQVVKIHGQQGADCNRKAPSLSLYQYPTTSRAPFIPASPYGCLQFFCKSFSPITNLQPIDAFLWVAGNIWVAILQSVSCTLPSNNGGCRAAITPRGRMGLVNLYLHCPPQMRGRGKVQELSQSLKSSSSDCYMMFPQVKSVW